MKKCICICLAAILLLTGCAGNAPQQTQPATTEVTQSQEEAAVYKILMIGQSLAQDTVWLLCDVLNAQMPDQEVLVADIYASISLGDHRKNIESNAAVYHYYQFSNGHKTAAEGYTIDAALKQEQWDLIIFNDATYPTTQESEFLDGDHAFMIDHIRKTAAPGFKLAYNVTWANPTSAELYQAARRQPPESFRDNYMSRFAGSRNLYYSMICENIKKYIETNEEYDIVFHPGTAIQYASETHGVPEAVPQRDYDLYRDYVHLSDFGRLIVAYQLYAQIFGLEELTSVNVDVIPAGHRATYREQEFGDIEITQQHKDAIIASVNYALKNPNTNPPQTAREPAYLEPLS